MKYRTSILNPHFRENRNSASPEREKWLKDRKSRTLSADDIAHYQRIVVALNETIRLVAEIDRVIKTHGGWPGAFAGKGAES